MFKTLLAIAFLSLLSINHAVAAGSACVGNLVWLDTNGDGIRSGGEPGFPNIEIRLKRGNSVVDSFVTQTGYFSLCSRALGAHTLEIDVPSGYTISPANAGNSDHTDSDADASGTIPVLTIANRKQTKYDFGITPLGTQPEVAAQSTGQQVESEAAQSAALIYSGDSNLFGPWVENRHRNDGVFGRFKAALLWSRTSEILAILKDARASNTSLVLQLGSSEEWGWNFSNNTSRFTMAKWKRSVDRFAENSTIHRALRDAIADGVVRAIYLIDEPHHTRWSPSGNSHKHISNADIDEMARYVKSYWPGVSTAVRASPRTLYSYGRDQRTWRFLDEAFLMINYRKWKNNGQRTIEAFMEREISEANRQGLGLIGSIQMLIGAPTSDRDWWPRINSGGPKPVGKLKVSPDEIEAYVEAFLQPRNVRGEVDSRGIRRVNDIFIFRWDRNNERDWQNSHYSNTLDNVVDLMDSL